MNATTNRRQRGATPGAGATPAQLIRSNNRWRESYNPLRGLLLSRVVSLLEAGERGEFADLQWLYRFVERRYPVLRSLVMRRRAAISKLSWTVKVKEGLDGQEGEAKSEPGPEQERLMALAEKQREFLQGAYGKIKNLNRAIRHLALAEFRGYAICQKHRDEAGDVVELHWLPQWNWVRDGMFGDWFWNAEARSTGWQGLGEENRVLSRGDAETRRLNRTDFVIREVEMPIDEIGAIAFLRTNLSQKDWDAFIELFGLPGCVVVMPPNIPVGKEEDYKSAAQSVAEGASGALPNGADAKFPTGGVRQGAPFKEHLEWQEKDVVLAGTGGKLTMLTGPTGLGGGQAEVHEDVFDEIATAEAAEISEVLHEDFDLPLLEQAFPGEPVLARFALVPVDNTAEQTKAFKREVFKGFMQDGTVVDILANQTDLKRLTQDVDLPVNEEYVDPYVPVVDQGGAPVSGEVVRDGEGDIIGARPGGVDISRGGAETAGEGKAETLKTETLKADELTPRRQDAKVQGSERGEEGEGVRNREATTAEGRVARAVAADLAPVRERLERILGIEDTEILRAKLGAFREELDRLKADLAADPEVAREIEGLITDGLINGLTQRR